MKARATNARNTAKPVMMIGMAGLLVSPSTAAPSVSTSSSTRFSGAICCASCSAATNPRNIAVAVREISSARSSVGAVPTTSSTGSFRPPGNRSSPAGCVVRRIAVIDSVSSSSRPTSASTASFTRAPATM